MQQCFETFLRQSLADGLSADFVHNLVERPGRTAEEFSQSQIEQQFQLAAILQGSPGEGLCGFVADSD